MAVLPVPLLLLLVRLFRRVELVLEVRPRDLQLALAVRASVVNVICRLVLYT